jgi:ABC-type Zn uptake system ZnuABC Zn-binding protein ZnuA
MVDHLLRLFCAAPKELPGELRKHGWLSPFIESQALARDDRATGRDVLGIPAMPPTLEGRCRGPRPGARAAAAGIVGLLALAVSVISAAAASPRVAATIFPISDIVRQVAGSAADVVLVLPPGASPHTFEPTPATVRALSGASLLFVVGHGLDDWAARLARGGGVPRLVPVDAGIRLRRADDGVDPHYWLSAPNGKRIARTVAAELERLAPDRRPAIQRSLAAYLARLDATDAEIRRLLADLPTRRIATVHDAFGYFAGTYGLEIVTTFEPYPGREPGPRFVVEFQRRIRASGVRVVFTEPQLSVGALAPIARDLGVSLGVLDPLGGLPGREGYLELLLFDARAVAAAARGRTP